MVYLKPKESYEKALHNLTGEDILVLDLALTSLRSSIAKNPSLLKNQDECDSLDALHNAVLKLRRDG